MLYIMRINIGASVLVIIPFLIVSASTLVPPSYHFTASANNNTYQNNIPADSPDLSGCILSEAQHRDQYDKKGTITIKKFNPDINELVRNSVFRITPNPHTINDSLVVNDNDKNIDCNKTEGEIQINNARYSSYHITEIDPLSSSVLHDTMVAITETLPNMAVNIITKDMGPQAVKSIYLQNDKIPNQFLVMLKDTASDSPQSFADQISSKDGVKVNHIFNNTIKGVGIVVENEQSLNEILFDPRVKFFEPDYLGRISSSTKDTTQVMPTGISRAIERGEQNQKNTDADIAIIDSGISLVHPDLNVYRIVSFVEVNGTFSANDDNGHGTLVAGIAAARDNSMGIIGAAPGARLWALKVCDKMGNCPVSNQIAAVDLVTQYSNQIDVVNISIENPHSSAYNNAIAKSVAKGITYTVAAGNAGRDAVSTSPANAPTVIAVSAIADSDGKCGGTGRTTTGGSDDTFANFSNFGPVVDIAAPGVDIVSTYKDTDYAVDTGASMAAAHVAGAVALYKADHPLSSPSEIRDWLMESGSAPSTKCDSKAHGYFSGDYDLFPEPLLYYSQDDGNFSK